MNAFTTFFAICCLALAAKAKPGIGHMGLVGIPDLQSFGGITYPKYEIIHLGEYSKGFVPGDEIHESKHETVEVPKPYPVKIPVPQPYPVHIAKPYPVVETKYVKVPHAVPYEIVKHVPVPVEVPKPYPVPANEHGDSYGAGSSPVYGIGHNGDENIGAAVIYQAQDSDEEIASNGLEQHDLPHERQESQSFLQEEH